MMTPTAEGPRRMSLKGRLTRWAGAATALLTVVGGGLTIADTLNWVHWAFSENFLYPTSALTLEISAFRGIALVNDLSIRCGTR